MAERIYTVGLEEHALTSTLLHAYATAPQAMRDDSVILTPGETEARLLDLGEGRISSMDDAGIDHQVLSIGTPGVQCFARSDALPLARDANDELAAAVAAYPDRLSAFATLPTPDPDAAADELRRAVRQLGLVGAMIFPRTGESYLDDEKFRPIFEAADELGVPLYLHPQVPPRAVRDSYYSGCSAPVDASLACGGWGWHVDAGLCCLRLILAGTFDRHPDLQLILGHWGELVVSYCDRIDRLSDVSRHLDRRINEYVTSNIYATPSGIYSHRMLTYSLACLGADRIMFSTDYPFIDSEGGRARRFLDDAPISINDKTRIGSATACRLLGVNVKTVP